MTTPELPYEEVIAAARRVMEARIVGALTTVAGDGTPHTRWMAGVPDGPGLSRVLSLTVRGSRKLDHLTNNSRVCWLFSDSRDEEVVKLTGTMRVLESQTMVEPVWQQLEAAARQYAMNLLSEPENLWFVGLDTLVDSVEYMAPKNGLTHPVVYPV